MKHIKKMLGFAVSCCMVLGIATFVAGCGSKHEHTYGDWKFDESEHWQECTADDCTEEAGYKFNTAAHTGDKCDVCDYEKKATPTPAEHKHSYSAWKFDENEHWKECTASGCTDAAGTKYEKGAHDIDELVCSVCGYEIVEDGPAVHQHTPDDEWHFDASGHWHLCTDENCPTADEKLNFAAHDGDCDICGYTEGTICPPDEHEHTPDDEWHYDATGHWHLCTDENCPTADAKLDFAAHDGDCDICGYTESKTPVEHQHTPDNEWHSDATGHWHLCTDENCPTAGEQLDFTAHDGDCDVCGYTESQTPVEHQHTYGEWQSDANGHWRVCTSSTCPNAGEHLDAAEHKGNPCEICNYTTTVTPAHQHVAGTGWMRDENKHWHSCIAANCDEPGIKLNEAPHSGNPCECGYTAPVHEHSYGEWQSDENGHWHFCTSSACPNAGERLDADEHKGNPCEICNFSTTVTPPAHQHVVGTAWEYDDNSHWHACVAEDCDDPNVRFNESKHSINRYICTTCGYEEEFFTSEYIGTWTGVGIGSGDDGEEYTIVISKGKLLINGEQQVVNLGQNGGYTLFYHGRNFGIITIENGKLVFSAKPIGSSTDVFHVECTKAADAD